MPLKQNGHSRGATFVEASASVSFEAREYSRSIHHGSGKKWDSNKSFAAEGFAYFYSISEEKWSYSLQSITRQQKHSVDLRQGGVKSRVTVQW